MQQRMFIKNAKLIFVSGLNRSNAIEQRSGEKANEISKTNQL